MLAIANFTSDIPLEKYQQMGFLYTKTPAAVEYRTIASASAIPVDQLLLIALCRGWP